jgi:hypothetical protein
MGKGTTHLDRDSFVKSSVLIRSVFLVQMARSDVPRSTSANPRIVQMPVHTTLPKPDSGRRLNRSLKIILTALLIAFPVMELFAFTFKGCGGTVCPALRSAWGGIKPAVDENTKFAESARLPPAHIPKLKPGMHFILKSGDIIGPVVLPANLEILFTSDGEFNFESVPDARSPCHRLLAVSAPVEERHYFRACSQNVNIWIIGVRRRAAG